MKRWLATLTLLLSGSAWGAEPSKLMSPKLTQPTQPLPVILTGAAAADC